MGFLDNLYSNYSDLKKYGISEEEAKELDMLDGSEDKKLYGKSLFTEIEKFNQEYKEDSKQIDFISYIKNRIRLTDKKENNSANKIAKNLITEIFSLKKSNLSPYIQQINGDNVVEVLEAYKKQSDEKNSILGYKYDNETLFEAILDENIDNKEKKEFIEHIKNALLEKAKNLGGNEDYTGKLFEWTLVQTLTDSWPIQDSKCLDEMYEKFLEAFKEIERLKNCDKENKNFNLKVSLSKVESSLRLYELDSADLYGNGKLDNPVRQTTGNCVLHSQINSVLTTDKGKEYLNSLISKDNKTGVITIFLPGAKNKNVPKENPGYYTYSEADLLNRTLETSIGDGDYTALVCAIEDCRKEISGDTNATSVMSSSNVNMAELLFGKDFTPFIFDKNAQYKVKENIKTCLINLASLEDSDNLELIEKCEKQLASFQEFLKNYGDYQDLQKGFNSGKLAVRAGLVSKENQIIKGWQEGKEIELPNNHAYTVIQMNNNDVVLTESNEPNKTIVISKNDFEKMYVSYFDTSEL